MRRTRMFVTAPALLIVLAHAPAASAGQVEITVGDGSGEFVPASDVANVGDQIIWIWAGGDHTVTSGSAPNFDGTFRSSAGSAGTSAKQFSWKATSSGTISYFCATHGSQAAITIVPGGLPAADMRITEVEFAGSGGQDRVQVSNLGDATGSLGFYRLSSEIGTSTRVDVDPITLPPNARVTLHLGAGGTDTATDVYVPAATPLGSAGSFALYVPNNTTAAEGSSNPASLTDGNQMVDFVEWGTFGQPSPPNELTAVAAGKWIMGDAVEVGSLPNHGAGYSISFCGTAADRGVGFWHVSAPNFGSGAPCTTPARDLTWGELKSLYR